MAIITDWIGREYEVSAVEAKIVAECKARHSEYSKKGKQAFNELNDLLSRFYAEKAIAEEDAINEIIKRHEHLTPPI